MGLVSAEAVCYAPLLDRRNNVLREAVREGRITDAFEFHDAWRCSACGREFPTQPSTERHIEFEHTAV
jgi:hypothetical protein